MHKELEEKSEYFNAASEALEKIVAQALREAPRSVRTGALNVAVKRKNDLETSYMIVQVDYDEARDKVEMAEQVRVCGASMCTADGSVRKVATTDSSGGSNVITPPSSRLASLVAGLPRNIRVLVLRSKAAVRCPQEAHHAPLREEESPA